MSRYFNLDEILENDEEARKNLSRFARKENEKSGSESNLSTVEEGKKASPFTDDVFRVLSLFCRNRDGAIRMKALTALGKNCFPEYFSKEVSESLWLHGFLYLFYGFADEFGILSMSKISLRQFCCRTSGLLTEN